MYVSRIEADVTVPPIEAEAEAPRGSFMVGALVLAVALPYGLARLFGSLLWRDIGRLARFVRMCGSAYAETRGRARG